MVERKKEEEIGSHLPLMYGIGLTQYKSAEYRSPLSDVMDGIYNVYNERVSMQWDYI